MNGEGDLFGTMIVFFIVFIFAGLILSAVFGDARIGFFISLLAGIIVCGGGKLIWHYNS